MKTFFRLGTWRNNCRNLNLKLRKSRLKKLWRWNVERMLSTREASSNCSSSRVATPSCSHPAQVEVTQELSRLRESRILLRSRLSRDSRFKRPNQHRGFTIHLRYLLHEFRRRVSSTRSWHWSGRDLQRGRRSSFNISSSWRWCKARRSMTRSQNLKSWFTILASRKKLTRRRSKPSSCRRCKIGTVTICTNLLPGNRFGRGLR